MCDGIEFQGMQKLKCQSGSSADGSTSLLLDDAVKLVTFISATDKTVISVVGQQHRPEGSISHQRMIPLMLHSRTKHDANYSFI